MCTAAYIPEAGERRRPTEATFDEIWFGIQQTVVGEATDDWRRGPVSVQKDVILNICCNINCSMSSVDICTLNG